MAEQQEIAYLSDIDGPSGNIAVFGASGLADGGIKPANVALKSEMVEDVQTAVNAATLEIWHAVNGVYAIEAYKSNEWESGVEYSLGDFCMREGSGYVCMASPHPDDTEFDPSEWRLVLTPEGKAALDALTSGVSRDGLATLRNLAPSYDSTKTYVPWELCIKDGHLQMCTVGGHTTAEFTSDTSVETSIMERLASLPAVPTKVSQLENDEGYVGKDAVGMEYNTDESGYAVGDTCTHDGMFYRCVAEVDEGDLWDPDDWELTTFRDVVASWVIHTHPDWNETDPDNPAYIENKPVVPVVDSTLTHAGEAADAKVVGDRLADVVSLSSLPYRIVNLLEDTSDGDATKMVFNLEDRAVNIVDVGTVNDNRVISLVPPDAPDSPPGVSLSRDFYVVVHAESDELDKISIEVVPASLRDCAGETASVYAPAGKRVTFRLTETGAGSTYTVSGFGDTTFQKMLEIEKAIDDALAGVTGGGEYPEGVYIPDDDGLYHKVTAVTDPTTGETNIGVEDEGVPPGDFATSVSIPDEYGDYHKLVAKVDPETGEANIGVE